MEQQYKLYLRKDILFAIATVAIIYLLQKIYLLLQTDNINYITLTTDDAAKTVQIILIISIIKLLVVILSGFFLTLYLSSYKLRNVITLGVCVGFIWGIIGLIQIIFTMISTPPQFVDTSNQSLIDVLIFIPKEIFVDTLVTCLGFLFAYSNKSTSLKNKES